MSAASMAESSADSVSPGSGDRFEADGLVPAAAAGLRLMQPHEISLGRGEHCPAGARRCKPGRCGDCSGPALTQS